MPLALDRHHHRLRANGPAQRFTLVVRTVLALGFVAPGLTKVFGRAFAPGIDPSHPMGAYFEAFHGTGGYYVFVGLVQAAAGALLLWRRTALPAACVYTVVIANIFGLVVATDFGTGTITIAGLMLAGCLWLLGWDAHRLAPLFGARVVPELPREPAAWEVLAPTAAPAGVLWAVRAAYALGFGALLAFTLAMRSLASAEAVPFLAAAVAAAGLVTLAAWAVHLVHRPSPRPASSPHA